MSGQPTHEQHKQHKASVLSASLVVLVVLVLVQGRCMPQSPASIILSVVAFALGIASLAFLLSLRPSPVRYESQDELSASEDASTEAAQQENSQNVRSSYEQFIQALVNTPQPLALLQAVLRDIRKREEQATEQLLATYDELHKANGASEAVELNVPYGSDTPAKLHEVASLNNSEHEQAEYSAPNGFERYLASLLEHAGIDAPDSDMPPIRVDLSDTNTLVNVRPLKRKLSYRAHLNILKIESALRRAGFALALSPDCAHMSLAECIEANRMLDSSICAQLHQASLTELFADASQQDSGEYRLRSTFVNALKRLTLPYRLTTHFRANVRDGMFAIQFDFTPASVFPKHFVESASGLVLPNSKSMRESCARDYALRVALILAALAFWSGPEIERVYIASVLDSATQHSCLFWASVDREHIDALDFSAISHPAEIWRTLNAHFDDQDGKLCPVVQGFSLEDEKFCPLRRYESLSLSKHTLDATSAKRLGIVHTSNLSINESEARETVAEAIVRKLNNSSADAVRTILELSSNNPDPSVVSAAHRTIEKIIEGSIDVSDAAQISDEFVSGDPISRALRRAYDMMSKPRPDYQATAHLLEEALEGLWATDQFLDTPRLSWRCFANYTERALYNHLHAHNEMVRLVPDTHYHTLLVLSSCYVALHSYERARQWATEAERFAPFDVRPSLILVRCDEECKDYQAAADRLVASLERAYDLETIGHLYYRLAFMEWKLGNKRLADACYQKCFFTDSSSAFLAIAERQNLLQTTAAFDSRKEIDSILQAAQIPCAPVDEVCQVISDAWRGALDAELFGAARNLGLVLGQITDDDIARDITRSIEREPDR